ncbi:hypothetical protein [Mycobacteroides abscessus]|uniref:hypothetical protein n=1 Tax=Mycobacteroides abscessus TaxID=36809 RepID=UPI000C2699D8|nr:hypothetical protein [Mycobacteroides abscessus]RIR96188.1 hypothetical protein D2E50_00800 [Mycobacteroides abscessus]RIU31421.1 hypothetical protein D2E86_01220 [Mycobacteroides abscessus]
MDYLLTAESYIQDDGTSLLTVERSGAPESDAAAELIADVLSLGVAPERLERRINPDGGVSLIYRLPYRLGLGVFVTTDHYQVDGRPLMIRANTERTDILRLPNIDPAHPLYKFATERANAHGHELQHRGTTDVPQYVGNVIHEYFWRPDAEMPDRPTEIMV